MLRFILYHYVVCLLLDSRLSGLGYKMKILITGATGFVGSRLCEFFSANNTVIPFSRKPGNKHESYDKIDEFMQEADAVIHCAAITEWFGFQNLFHEVNVLWPFSLAEKAKAHGVKIFIYISSIAVYGYRNHNHSLSEDDVHLTFLNRLRMTDYGLSKIGAEKLLSSVEGVRTVIFRCGLVYSDERLEMQKRNSFSGFVATARLPYVHISNVCHAVMHALQNEVVSGVYNMVDDEQPYTSQLVFSGDSYAKLSVYKLAAKEFIRSLIKRDRKALRVAWNMVDVACRQNTYNMSRLKSTGYRPERMIPVTDAVKSQNHNCPMKIALIGCGEWGQGFLQKLKHATLFKVCAICDLRMNNRVYGIPVYSNVSDMLNQHHFDGAIISTPNNFHLAHTEALSRHIRHLFIEKPLCNSRGEWTDLKRLSAEYSLCVTAGHSISRGKTALFFKESIKNKKIRAVSMIRSIQGNRGLGDWRSIPDLCPGGVIPQLAIHLFDLAHYFFSDFEIVDVNVIERLATGQVWKAIVEGATGVTPVELTVGFGNKNNFQIEVFLDDDRKISWDNGVLINQSGQRLMLPFDDGSWKLLDHYYSKWFRFDSGLDEHDIKVQQSYLKSLDFIVVHADEK
jgi:nucleoside-diphosphate-sugar epimerase/predicted dehydrogenase